MRPVASPCDMPVVLHGRGTVPVRTLVAAIAVLAAACDAPPRQGVRPSARPDASPRTAAEPPVLAYEGVNLTWSDLRPSLVELGGSTVLGDAILGRAVERELAARSITLGPEAIEAERELLRASLDADPDRSFRLLEEIRRRQGLGPQIFPNPAQNRIMLVAGRPGPVFRRHFAAGNLLGNVPPQFRFLANGFETVEALQVKIALHLLCAVAAQAMLLQEGLNRNRVTGRKLVEICVVLAFRR